MPKALVWIPFLFIFINVKSQSDSATRTLEARLSQISVLAQGIGLGIHRPPRGSHKGACRIFFRCKAGFFSPYADTASSIANCILSLVIRYALDNKFNRYDTLAVQYFSNTDTLQAASERRFIIRPGYRLPTMQSADRVFAVIRVLPFDTYCRVSGDKVNIELKIIEGYSPIDDTERYARTLAYVILVFGYPGQDREVRITYVSADGHKKQGYSIRLNNLVKPPSLPPII